MNEEKKPYICSSFMSKIRQKSNFNIDAAKLLIKEAYFAPSVHCSYYSCYQLLKYTIKDFFGVNHEDQAVNISTTGQKTHQYVVNYVSRELKRLTNSDESTKFKRKVKDLKQFRIESDYENIEVGIEKAQKAYDKAIEIRSYLTTSFKV